MKDQTLAQATKIMSVFAKHNVSPVALSQWGSSLKNVIIHTAVNLPDSNNKAELNIIKEDMQESKAAADFLEDLRVVMEE